MRLGLETFRQFDHRHWVIVGFVVSITSFLWILAKVAVEQPEDLWPWRGPSQILGLIALALMALGLVAGARSRSLEWLFGGLDRAIRLHRAIGVTAMILLVIHLLLLIPVWMARGIPIAELFVPFYSSGTRTIDILIFYSFVLLAILAYNQRLSYSKWQWLHRVNGGLFMLFSIEILFVPGSIRDFEPLRTWMIFLGIAGTLAFLYRVLLFRRFGPRYRYALNQVQPHAGNSYDLILRPKEQRMIYDPGTFAFISVPDSQVLPAELHPFSISSSPVSRELRFSIRAVGDYTRLLRDLPVDSLVDVYGPFGGFTLHAFMRYKRLVLIGAGIGITPFLSMLHFELTNNDFRRIWLYYVVRERADAGHDEEIRDSYLKADSYIDYELWVTKEQGRITAKAIADAVAPIDDYAVMLCGTVPFSRDMTRQLLAIGVPAERIIAEEFAFR